jgi:subfamily B ATP-binding cassette protein MsbA
VLPLFGPFWKPLAWAVAAMALDAALTVCRPWPLKVVIDRVISQPPRPSRVPGLGPWIDASGLDPMTVLYGACAATLLIALSTGLLTHAFTRAVGNIGQRFVFSLRRDVFTHMQRLSLRYHDRQASGDLITRLTSDMHAIQEMITNGTILLVSNGCLLVGMVVLMLWLDWRFALASLAVAPLLFWTVLRYTRRIKAAARQARTSEGLVASVAQETLTSIRIVQGLAQEQQQSDRLGAQSASSLAAYLEGIRYQARVAPLVDVLAAVGLVVVMWYGATRVRAGEISTGDVVVFFAYVTNLYSPMKALSRLSYSFNKASVGAERIAEVMGIRHEVTDRKGAHRASDLKGRIEFHDVSFAYDPGQTVLSRINLTIAPRERVAISGPSGAGKSTLASLVPRLYDPTTGAVSIDGVDLRDYTVQSLREHISLVLQDAMLFRASIRDNIAFGHPEASDAEIVAAAVTANAHEFIERLPDGYDTLVGEHGTTLSGGQKQRIAIARAILRNAPILILDEPTSDLDAESERAVVDALERAASGRTCLIISHRLTTLRFADRIIVLDAGRIAGEQTVFRGQYTELT